VYSLSTSDGSFGIVVLRLFGELAILLQRRCLRGRGLSQSRCEDVDSRGDWSPPNQDITDCDLLYWCCCERDMKCGEDKAAG
jgi:hypothetical protein